MVWPSFSRCAHLFWDFFLPQKKKKRALQLLSTLERGKQSHLRALQPQISPLLHAGSPPNMEAEDWHRLLHLSVSRRALPERRHSQRRIMSVLCSPQCEKRHPGNQFVSQFCAVIPSILWFTFYKMHLQTLLCKNNEFSDMHYFCHEGKQVLLLGLLAYLSSPLERGISS